MRPVTPVGDTMVTLVVASRFTPVRVTTTPVLAGPDVGETPVMLGCVVVSVSEPPAVPATPLMATMNIKLEPLCPVTPVTTQVIEVAEIHVADEHAVSTPVAP